ncbi:hypothetical protein I312_106544 [Cryptococcus bacillisporus CA1280]|uniref:Glutamyl-tRNA(Gln) amidotransferase subunit F, mitochondrial n=2 Tax=Cryptococcus gattii TaxID=552467 RepID=A0A0D0VB53_CRYGA|nr:hypothetical protein I312_05985 [Cryptococcus bacillisporus CA1280]KIR58440.1 hypothetical protein I314_05684 [Cryptococcus bacillisporus CA1873]|eukprot:KIR58440.1 hypothetical protein I314_05684 [Cryptococcus gattii CA1873]
MRSATVIPSLRAFQPTLRRSLSRHSKRYTSTSTSQPIQPLSTPVSEPTPASISELPTLGIMPTIKPVHITRQQLEKLHTLSALAPPPAGSQEEKQLLDELSELVGLMELVKDVELPQEEIEGLLAEGVGAVRIGEIDLKDEGKAENKVNGREKSGQDLLDWSPTRLGDYYSSALKK